MKISVIIPVYNSEKYLEACLDSIINQTYKNLEIILVDDGSTDKSPYICDTYADRYEFIHTIHQVNQGVSSARNNGMKYITGELVSFIDSDDTLDQDMYELLLSLFESDEIDIVHCGYKHIVHEEVRLVHDTKILYNQSREEALSCLVGSRLFVGSLWNKLFKKEVLEGIQFRTDIKINEDILFCFEAFCKARRIVFADYAKYNYIAHMDSSACFITNDSKKIKDRCTVNMIIWNRLKDSAVKNSAGERAINSLSSYYRYCLKEKSATRQAAYKCKRKIFTIYKQLDHPSRNTSITVKLLKYCPLVYPLVYGLYDRVRKPYWEV